MACTIEEIKRDSLQNFVTEFNALSKNDRGGTIKGFDSEGRMEFNYDISKKYKSEDAALRTREIVKNKIKPVVEKWAAKTFGKSFSKGFLTETQGKYPALKFNFPTYLEEAYNRKIEYEAQKEKEELSYLKARGEEEQRLREEGQVILDEYNERINGIEEFDDFPMNTVNPVSENIIQPNFNDYLEHKKKLLKNVNKTITRLYNDKRLHSSTEVTRKIARFNYIKEALENDIKNFNKPIDRVELIRDYFEKDITTINELLSNPTLDNVFMAKSMFEYLEKTKKSEAKEGDIFALKNKEKFEPEVEKIIKDIESVLEDTKNKINDTIDDIFLQLLEKNENSLAKLYPGKSLDEIKDELLKSLQDINNVESFFFTQGKNLTTENNLIDQLIILEYKREQHYQNSKTKPIIQSIDQSIPSIEAELKKLGKFFKFKNKEIYDYTWMYRANEPQLVSKFSKYWEESDAKLIKKYRDEVKEAREKLDWVEAERLLKNKFNDLNDKVEFINFTLLHDVFEQGEYDEFKRGTSQEAENYKNEIISKIGKEEYEKLIERQQNLLDDYQEKVNNIINFRLNQEGVDSIDKISDINKDNIENSIKRISPLFFIESYLSGNKGMIETKYGTQKDEKPSFLDFNTYIPKTKNNLGFDTNFYDNNFTEIENNPVLYDFWQRMRQGILLINENLVDSDMQLKHDSILSFKEGITKEVLNKTFKTQLKELTWRNSWENFKSLFKDLVSTKKMKYNDSDYVQLAKQLKSIEGEVKNEHDLLKTEVSNIVGTTLLSNTVVNWHALSLDQKDKIIKATGAENEQDFLTKAGVGMKGLFKASDLEVFAKIKVMNQQALNLPAVIKGLLELSADHKARTISKNETNIYRMKSAGIPIAETKYGQREGGLRQNEMEREKYFYEKVILNKHEQTELGISKWIINRLGTDTFDGVEMCKKFYKNFSATEKIIFNSAVQRIEQIDKEIEKTKAPSKLALLNEEKAAHVQRINLMGKDYSLSALFDTAANKVRVRTGLSYNVLAGLNNYKQGFITTLNRDGEFWQRGNIYPVIHFVDLASSRFVNPKYKAKWDLAKLFIDQLDIIETGTNELQKAEAEIKNRAKWTQPMFITEKVEYRNQAKGILAMAMDVEVEHATEKNSDGTPAKYPLFNGTDFIPLMNDNGVLKLKPEFDTPINREHFINMTSKEISDWKLNVEDMNKSMNGDYTRTGVTRIKHNLYTRPLMTFKTWIPEYIWARWRYNQKNLLTGKTETGYMLSSLLNKKTSVAAGVMLGVTGIMSIITAAPITLAGAGIFGIISAIPVIGAGLLTLGSTGYGAWKYVSIKKKTSNSQFIIDPVEPIGVIEQAWYVLKMLGSPVSLLEMPVNTIMGKEFIKPTEFDAKHNLTPEEKTQIRLMARNTQQLALIMLVKLAIQAMFADNEDDEPKGEKGSEQRARYEAQKARRDEGNKLYNFLENQVSATFNETSFGTDPFQVWDTATEGGIKAQMDNLLKIMTGIFSPFEEVKKGPRKGQNKLGNAIRSTFIPSLFRGIGQDTYAGGFESSMLTEWNKNDGFDDLFESDYKVDKQTAKEERNQKKEDLIRQYEEANDVDYDAMTEEEQDDVDAIVKEQMKDEFDNPDRSQYDESQSIIEE